MRREAIQGALIAVTLVLGLPILRSLNAAETARLMIYAARQARAWSIGALPCRKRRPKGKRRAQLQMLQGLPGIGPERARRLLDAFGNVESVLMASSDELQSLDGMVPLPLMRFVGWCPKARRSISRQVGSAC